MSGGTRSRGNLNVPKDLGDYWTKGKVAPLQAPTKSVFKGKFQYIRFDDPPGLTDDEIRTLGFYNHAYAPIGNDNALYTPMPGDMFRRINFEYILLPDAQKISMSQYIESRNPQKTYMSLAYFKALFQGTLPRSYGEPKKKLMPKDQDKRRSYEEPKKKLKTESQDKKPQKTGLEFDIMQECDFPITVSDPDIPMVFSKLEKKKARKNHDDGIEKLDAGGKRIRIALEEFSRYGDLKTNTVVPFRNDYGAICYALISRKLETKDLCKALLPYWKDGRAQKPSAGSKGFNTRNEKYRMSKPLKIHVQQMGRQRFGDNWRPIFKEIIQCICAMDGMKNQLEFVEDDSDSSGYILLATDPFGLYTAYIHEDCVHQYMEYLCKPEKVEPATVAGDDDDLQVSPDAAATTTAEQASGATMQIENQGTTTATAIKNSVRAMPDKDFIGRMENLLDDAFHNTSQRAKIAGPSKQKLPANQQTIPQKNLSGEQKEQLAELWKQETPLAKLPYITESGSIGLSWAKINGASGTRMDPTKNKAQQGETMKTSAGLMAVTTLGWDHYELTQTSGRLMKSGCHIAEWLHLCAYSWGGPTPSTSFDQAALTDSQGAKNLVFGSSEANSCMTRYEKSWQKLIEHENTLFNISGNSGANKGNNLKVPDRLTGSLHVTRNPKSTTSQGRSDNAGDVWVDEKDASGRYKWSLRKNYLTTSLRTEPHLTKAAKKFPSIAYSIEYKIGLDGHSKILNRTYAKSTNYFYPFSRRFYHRAENLLDRSLYQLMILLALNEEYDKLEAWGIFKDWFKTVLLPEEVIKDYKPVSPDSVASTAIPVNTTSFPGLFMPPPTSLEAGFEAALKLVGIHTNSQPLGSSAPMAKRQLGSTTNSHRIRFGGPSS